MTVVYDTLSNLNNNPGDNHLLNDSDEPDHRLVPNTQSLIMAGGGGGGGGGRKKKESSTEYNSEKQLCLQYFESWSEQDQLEFMEHLLSGMCHYQHGHINAFLKPMLQRDFISLLPSMYSFILVLIYP